MACTEDDRFRPAPERPLDWSDRAVMMRLLVCRAPRPEEHGFMVSD